MASCSRQEAPGTGGEARRLVRDCVGELVPSIQGCELDALGLAIEARAHIHGPTLGSVFGGLLLQRK